MIEIDVARIDDRLELTVRDDGVGFDPQATLAGEPSARSFGLLGMRERATAVGGTLAITARPGTGTTVAARLPLTFASASPAVEPLALPAAVPAELLPSHSPLA
jgi:signal transduction histidine kinase